MKKIITSTVLILMLLLLCVSCNNAVEEATGVGYVNLSDVVTESASRSLSEADSAVYGKEDLYWTYTAVKTGPLPIRDTTGETGDRGEKVVSYLGDSEDKDFSNHKGLDDKVIGPLAVGTWKITVYGYLNDTLPDGDGYATAKVAQGNVLIYTSEEAYEKEIVACEKEEARSSASNPKNQIGPIQLKSPASLDGYLRFSASPEEAAFTLKVPENMTFYSGSGVPGDEVAEIVVKMIDVTRGDTATTGAIVVAESRTTLLPNTTYKPDDPDYNTITLSAFEFTDAVSGSLVVLDDNKKYYPLTPEVHKFQVIVEYKDSWTCGDNEYDKTNSTTHEQSARYKEDSFYDKDYAPVGDIITFPLKSVGGLKMVLSGDVNDIKANGGDLELVKFAVADCAVVYWKANGDGTYSKDTAKLPVYYGTLQDAINGWLKDIGDVPPSLLPDQLPKYRITVLRNIDDAGVVKTLKEKDRDGNPITPSPIDVPIYLDGHYIDKLIIDGGSNAEGSVIFCIPDTTSGQENDYSKPSRITIKPYKEGSPATAVKPQVKNISYKAGTSGNAVTSIFLDGGDCVIEARGNDTSNHTVYLSGKARNVKVGKTGEDYIPAVKLGTKTECEVEELAVLGGKVELGNWTKVKKLALDGALAAGSSLKGTTSAYVGNFNISESDTNFDKDIRFRKVVRPGQAIASADVMTADQERVFKKITLWANNVTTGEESSRTLYGIEGMNLNLLAFNKVSSPEWTKAEGGVDCTFMLWNTKRNMEGSADSPAVSYGDCATLVTPSDDNTDLYAIWAQPLGGKVFFINATGDWTDVKSYHFFGAQKKEIGLWQNSGDIAKALSGAVYALNTDSSVNNKVYVAYTNTDPRTSEGNIALYENGEYNRFYDYDKVTELKNNTSIGAGKTNTETVLGALVTTPMSTDSNSVFRGIQKMRTYKVNGQNDWFIGCEAEYKKLTASTLDRPPRITTLTVDGSGRVHTYTGDVYLSSWSLLPYGEDNRAFLVPLRSF